MGDLDVGRQAPLGVIEDKTQPRPRGGPFHAASLSVTINRLRGSALEGVACPHAPYPLVGRPAC